MSSFERDVVLGFGNDIAANSAAEVPLWIDTDKDGEPQQVAETPGAVGIYVDVWPENVDSVTLTDYAISDDPSLSDSVVGVQVAVWAEDRGKLRAIISDIFDLMHGRWGGTMGNVRFSTITRRSGANLGQNSSGRIGRSENYYIQAHRPSGHRQ